ncbi:MAG TPA: CRISPR-associated endonuclease Cas2 [Thiotrichaceae bacterium]|nr:CRISPR-associated endonuclease Cas2 [Thiotrichaceae bacterium]
MTTTTLPREGDHPYVFAYDITDNDRRKAVLNCLKRWRVDGQYSVHETWLRPFQVRELSVELIGLIDRKQDRLLVCRLDQRRSTPIYQMQLSVTKQPLVGKPRPVPVPAQLSQGDYLICYDIREKKRLQRIQRLMAKRTLYLQRSVYLYRGKGNALLTLLEAVGTEMQDDDDVRIYNLIHVRDMWFLSHEKPVVPEIHSQKTELIAKRGIKTLFQRFKNLFYR